MIITMWVNHKNKILKHVDTFVSNVKEEIHKSLEGRIASSDVTQELLEKWIM